ncbi:peptidase C50, separase [Tanacetum coccineum]
MRHGLDSCLAEFGQCNRIRLHKCKVKANDLGSLYFLQAQALCLRALSRYENYQSGSNIILTEDIEKVLKDCNLYCKDDFLIIGTIDEMIQRTDRKNNLFKCDQIEDVGMLWQFKSHHSHLKSELIDDYFAENCNFSMEEGGHSEEPERMVSNIAIKVTKSLKSRCRAAHFYYDQGERMLLMGKMTKALDHAREGYERRYHLLKENFELTLRDAKKIYKKAQDINEAKKELRQAEELCRCVSCKSCQLLLKLEIRKESAKQKRKFGTTWDITSAMQEFLSIEVLLKMQLNAKPSRKGHKNSKYGCRCWECTCRFSLLSLLKEKGDFSIPSETLIATLKHALILSSETPELLKKEGLGELWKAPWGTDTIVDTILPDFKWIVKDFEDGISAGTLDGRISNIIWYSEKVVIFLTDVAWESIEGNWKPRYYKMMPSVSSIFYTYQKCYKSQRKAVRDYASYATLDPFDAYYVINPTGITYGEYCLSEWLKNEFRLEGTCHKPVVKEISEILKTHNLFIYVGHGHGLQHIPIDALAKLDKCASAILMGCYSGLLELEGPYIPKGAPIDYVLAGSPIVVGNLWVVRQTWHRIYQEITQDI